MEKYEEELISRFIDTDPVLKQTVEEHRSYEQQLDGFEKKPYLTTQEDTEMKRIKKLKLRAKDRIEAILATYRKQYSQ